MSAAEGRPGAAQAALLDDQAAQILAGLMAGRNVAAVLADPADRGPLEARLEAFGCRLAADLGRVRLRRRCARFVIAGVVPPPALRHFNGVLSVSPLVGGAEGRAWRALADLLQARQEVRSAKRRGRDRAPKGALERLAVRL